MNNTKKKKVILSCSGGGVRGILIVSFLACLEKVLPKPLTEYFDFYAGTSVGSLIIGCLLHSNMTAKEILDDVLDSNTLNRIMHQTISDRIFGLFQNNPKYTGKQKKLVIEEKLKDVKFGSDEIKKRCKDILITGWDIQNKRPLIFRSWIPKGANLYAKDIMDLSTAAPGFYPGVAIRTDEGTIYGADGAIFANNPVDCAYAEALELYGENTDFVIISFGTGTNDTPLTKKESEYALYYGGIQWAVKGNILGAVMEGAKENAHENTRTYSKALGDTYININGHVNNLKLDDTSEKNINYLREEGERWFAKFGKRVIDALLYN